MAELNPRYQRLHLLSYSVNLDTSDAQYTTRSKNIPFLGDKNGKSVDADPAHYSHRIEEGFSVQYEAIRRDSRSAEGLRGPYARIPFLTLRVIARPTWVYSNLLVDLTHPYVLRSALREDLLLDSLYVNLPKEIQSAQLIAAERDALRKGDIPFFQVVARSSRMQSETGETVLELARSTLAEFQLQVSKFLHTDLTLQRWLIAASCATAEQQARIPSDLSMAEVMRSNIDALASLLLNLCVADERYATWLVKDSNSGNIQPASMSFLDGLPGIVAVVSYLPSYVADSELSESAKKCAMSACRMIEDLIYRNINGQETYTPEILASAAYCLTLVAQTLP